MKLTNEKYLIRDELI